MKNRFGDRYKILCGVDTIAMEELLLGADGWVAGLVNAFPNETVAIYRISEIRKDRRSNKNLSLVYAIAGIRYSSKIVQYIKLAAGANRPGN